MKNTKSLALNAMAVVLVMATAIFAVAGAIQLPQLAGVAIGLESLLLVVVLVCLVREARDAGAGRQ